jgi:excinuclease ABC subunit C
MDGFPRLKVTNRPPASRENSEAHFYGPFRTREVAQYYEQEISGLFQIRRCVEDLSPSPEHPGCIYGEMNQCLRPCQCVVTSEEYGAETRRVSEFLGTNGATALSALTIACERASNELDFEQAAQIHKRIEKIRNAAGAREAVTGPLDGFSGIALTRSSKPRVFYLWPLWNAIWQDPIALDFSMEDGSSKTQSLDMQIRERISAALAAAQGEGNRTEELAVFARWYFSSWRDGNWFPFGTIADVPYRKLVREVSQLYKLAATPVV